MRDDFRAKALRTVALECSYSSRRLAKLLGISQRKLQHLFKTELDCTPQVWLREERLQAARTMLASSSTVKQVAYALGFRQESQFCRDFKLRFGLSPSAHLPLRGASLNLERLLRVRSSGLVGGFSKGGRGAEDDDSSSR